LRARYIDRSRAGDRGPRRAQGWRPAAVGCEPRQPSAGRPLAAGATCRPRAILDHDLHLHGAGNGYRMRRQAHQSLAGRGRRCSL